MPLEAFATLILLVALAIILYGPWQTFCTDAARQTLFEIRDELFDLGARGELPFNSAEYRTIRTSIEQNIRYAHTLTIWRFFALVAHILKCGDVQKSERTRAIESIKNPQVRAKAMDMSNRILRTNLLMMVVKSPLLIALMFVWYVVFKICKLFGGAMGQFTSYFAKAGEVIQVEAETACA